MQDTAGVVHPKAKSASAVQWAHSSLSRISVAQGTQRARRDISTGGILMIGTGSAIAGGTFFIAGGTVASSLVTIGTGTTLLLPKVGSLIASAQRVAKGGAQATRGLQALQKKIDRGDAAYSGLSKTQAQAETIIKEVFGSSRQIVQHGVNRAGQAFTDVFDAISGRGVRVVNGEFDTFVNK